MFEPFALPFVQRGLIEVLILAVPAGLLGTWIVMRGLAFFSHAVGSAAFPGLVLADGLGFAAPLGALGAALLLAAGTAGLRGRRGGADAAVALVLAGCLAGGAVLASDVFGSGARVETLLFGSLLLVDSADIALAAAVAAVTVAASALIGQHWLRSGFDPSLPAAAGPDPRLFDAILIVLVALAAVAALTVVGALLVAALFLVPAATVRLLTERLRTWQLASVALVAAEGTLGLWLSVRLNAPPGATIACLAGAAFVLVAAGRALARARRGGARLAAAALLGGVLVLAGCGGGDGEAGGEGGLSVVATTTQVADIVRSVGGERVEVHGLLRPNTDPHDYEPRPGDVLAVADADVIFASGAGLDGWIEEVAADGGSDAPIVDLAAALPARQPQEGGGEGEGEREADGDHGADPGHEREADGDHGADAGHDHEADRDHGADAGHDHEADGDPHWWQDPRNGAVAAAAVAAALGEAEPGARPAFRAGARRLRARLRALDARIAACIGSLPPAARRIVTDHDSFAAFADRYGLEVVGAAIPSQTSQGQPSAKDLSELAATIEAEGVRAVFPERGASGKVARAIAAQTGASAERALYGDSLGPAGSDGDTYPAMLAANAEAIMRGVTGGRRGCPPSR